MKQNTLLQAERNSPQKASDYSVPEGRTDTHDPQLQADRGFRTQP